MKKSMFLLLVFLGTNSWATISSPSAFSFVEKLKEDFIRLQTLGSAEDQHAELCKVVKEKVDVSGIGKSATGRLVRLDGFTPDEEKQIWELVPSIIVGVMLPKLDLLSTDVSLINIDSKTTKTEEEGVSRVMATLRARDGNDYKFQFLIQHDSTLGKQWIQEMQILGGLFSMRFSIQKIINDEYYAAAHNTNKPPSHIAFIQSLLSRLRYSKCP